MSEREWQPGEVAMVTFPGVVGDRLTTWADKCHAPSHPNVPHWHVAHRNTYLPAHAVTSARPLPVPDPENPDDLSRLAHLLISHGAILDDGGISHPGLAAALREYAAPTPPRPDEPTGRFAEVVDAHGDHWFRLYADHRGRDWAPEGQFSFGSRWRKWSDLDVPTADHILSHGVKEGTA